MTQKDQLKIIKAGFTLIRACQHNLHIKMKNLANLNWVVLYKGFKTKAALNRKMAELLEINTIIED